MDITYQYPRLMKPVFGSTEVRDRNKNRHL